MNGYSPSPAGGMPARPARGDMDVATVMAYGADVRTMLTGVGILGGVGAWIRKQQRDRREARDARKHGLSATIAFSLSAF